MGNRQVRVFVILEDVAFAASLLGDRWLQGSHDSFIKHVFQTLLSEGTALAIDSS